MTNLNSVTSLLPSYMFPFNRTATNVNTANSASSVQQPADVLGLSPAAQFLNQLQQLQTQNPPEFQAVLSQITGQLQQAASTASSNGNTAQANQLTQLASTFQSAASSGALPTAQQLQQAGLTVDHRHGGYSFSGSPQSKPYNPFQAANSVESQTQTLASSIFGSVIQRNALV